MNEKELYETIGRKQAALDALQADYRRFLAIVASIKAGATSLDCLTIDGDNWKLVSPDPEAPIESVVGVA